MAEYLNFLVTLGAAFIAYRAYISTTIDNRSKHVHDLFKEYLKSRIDNNKDPAEFIGLKLYALEEIYNWIKKIEKTVKSNRWLRPSRSDQDLIFCNAWMSTIRAHLEFEALETRAAITRFQNCYSPGFVKMALKSTTSPKPNAG